MKTKQKLNNFKEKYLDMYNWELIEKEKYNFHFLKNKYSREDKEYLVDKQEKSYQNILNILKLDERDKKINYYIYPNQTTKEEMMGDDGFAQAIWHDFSIHIVYNEKIKPLGEHEDTHLLTLDWGVAIGFFQEGLAEYTSGCFWGREKMPAEEFVKKGIELKKIPDLKNFFSHNFWMENAEENIEYFYPLAGLFTKFLIRFGKI